MSEKPGATSVHEAYWSPLDKNVTTAAKVLYWLLQTAFLPINDTARFMAPREKVRWDVGTVIAIVLTTTALWVAALVGLAWGLGATHLILNGDATSSLWSVDTGEIGGALSAFGQPFTVLGGLPTPAIVALILGAVGAFFGFQTCVAFSSFKINWDRLQQDPVQVSSRRLAIFVLGVLSFAALAAAVLLPMPRGGNLGIAAVAIIFSVALFEGGRLLASWFLPNFFGDVQIYTTRDANSTFFGLRESILNLVTDKIIDVIADKPAGENYDCVYVLAHSLGSTIALDTLMRIYNVQPSASVPAEAWQRIRGFVTFGTALEKTKYFFNAWNPTVSQSYDEWQDDLYGPLFTKEADVLKTANGPGVGIFWMNYWYFTDFVSNEITSYRSYVNVGAPMETAAGNRTLAKQAAETSSEPIAGRAVARNCKLPDGLFNLTPGERFRPVTHGDYLGDAAFWNGPVDEEGNHDLGALEVLRSCTPRSGDAGVAKVAKAPPDLLEEKRRSFRENARFEEMPDGARDDEASPPSAVVVKPEPLLHSFEVLTPEEARTTRGAIEPGKKPESTQSSEKMGT